MDEDVKALLEKHRYRQAFERLVELYGVKVYRLAVMFLKDTNRAEEVAQDIFLKLWQALPAYDGRAAPSTWLYTIARNTCLSALRSEAHRKTSPLDSIPEPAAARPFHFAAFRLCQQISLMCCGLLVTICAAFFP